MFHGRTMHILFHEQAICGRNTKWKKTHLTSMDNTVMWLYYFLVGSEKLSL